MTFPGPSRSAKDVLARLRRTFQQGPTQFEESTEPFACLKELADPGMLSAFLKDDRRRAGMAIDHQNGFLKLTLYEPPNAAFRLRLHVWIDVPEPVLPDIHNHTRDYWSVLLAGSLRIEEFAQRSDGHVYHEYVASNRTDDRRYTFDYRGTTRISLVRSENVASGDSHSASHTILHRVSVLKYPACTLFLQGPEQCSSTVVLSEQMKRSRESKLVRPHQHDIADALAAVGF